jgi:hypothetical protein
MTLEIESLWDFGNLTESEASFSSLLGTTEGVDHACKQLYFMRSCIVYPLMEFELICGHSFVSHFIHDTSLVSDFDPNRPSSGPTT